jgi:putative membrane-bound dehydrogenase-like protein
MKTYLRYVTFFLLALGLFSCKNKNERSERKKEIVEKVSYPKKNVELKAEDAAALAGKIKQEVNVELADGLELSLWASDTLVQDPIAISIDNAGKIYYTQATRQNNSEFDIRGHRNWMTASISFQTVEDRRKFLRETFAPDSEESKKHLKDLNNDGVKDWRDLTVEKEQVWVVEDRSGDGIADRAQLYLEDFNEEITDVANGVKVHEDNVFVSVGPDVWRTKDTDKDGVADTKTSISHGYAVHIGFSGHGMSGATVGPDGRLWWGIGDIGMNVVDKEGKNWKYPNQGVIARSEFDGSNFEVFAAGLRNTHEFVFDQYGNLITEDNDGDHPGERERLVYLIDGSDSGWRTNWQFGKYTDPDNNTYKVWMDEKLHIPRWEEQAAYILPPIANYVSGPTGMKFNPGTALGKKWQNHFFVAEFRGSQTNSPIHAFTLKPKGASFELANTQEVVKGLLPTGMDFGPDGALYFSDWVDGWGTKNKGRIWKLDVPNEANSAIRQATKKLITADFGKSSAAELSQWLQHEDMRVRQKAQFELVKRDQKGFDVLLAAAKQDKHQLARIHGLWGIGQLARQNAAYAKSLTAFLQDQDAEIVAQAAKMIGDVRYLGASQGLIALLKHDSPRVQLYATEALGRTKDESGIQPIVDLLIANNDQDAWLRHAAAIALGRIGKESALVALKNHDSQAVRIAVVVALRIMKSPQVAQFLRDESELVVTEAARAINDEFSIEAALPDLADVLKENRFTNEALLRRAINANLRVGKPENIKILANYTSNQSQPVAMRAEALEALSTWAKPSVMDRVDGHYRGEVARDAAGAKQAVLTILPNLLGEKGENLQLAAAKAVGRLKITEVAKEMLGLVKNSPSAEVRKAALNIWFSINSNLMNEILEIALADQDNKVRSEALEILAKSNLKEETAVKLLQKVLANGTDLEKQAALASLGSFKGKESVQVLEKLLDDLVSNRLSPAIQLDVIEAVEQQKAENLLAKLKAYQERKPKDDPLALYQETLVGGNVENGRHVYYNSEAAQCVRCHAIFEVGGNVGPGLASVGKRLSRKEILESIVAPSAKLAKGYEMLILTMKDEETISGIVMEETAKAIKLKIGKSDIRLVDKSKIANRRTAPSGMPPMGGMLTKREIRDLVAFLAELKEE